MDAIACLMNDLKRCKLLTKAEQIALARRAKQGDSEARNALIESILPLAAHVARRCRYREAIDLETLISEAMLGAIEGVDKFDPERNVALTTYAIYHIRKNIFLYASTRTSVISIPLCALGKRASVDRREAAKRARENVVPIRTGRHQHDAEEHKISDYRMSKQEERELDECVRAHQKRLRRAISQLSLRERLIVTARMNGETLAELGRLFKVSRERIRLAKESKDRDETKGQPGMSSKTRNLWTAASACVSRRSVGGRSFFESRMNARRRMGLPRVSSWMAARLLGCGRAVSFTGRAQTFTELRLHHVGTFEAGWGVGEHRRRHRGNCDLGSWRARETRIRGTESIAGQPFGD